MQKSGSYENAEATTKSVDSHAALSEFDQPHRLEQEVSRQLSAHPGLKFTSLVVHRTPGGVCLEGSLETHCNCDEVTQLALQVAGVNDVLNRLMLLSKEEQEKSRFADRTA